MEKKIKDIIDKYDVISFDIFDTALERNCCKPEDVFKIIGKKINDKTFYEKRMNIENQTIKETGKISPTINDIYKNFYDENVMKIEIDTEENILQANMEIKKVYDYCISKNKKVIFISDMYLTKEILERILKKNGYNNYFKLYVSSEYNKTKSNGDLFDFVIEDLNIKENKILHLGDSFKSDFLMAKKKGIRAYYYKKKNVKEKSYSLEDSIFTKFIKNNQPNKNIAYNYGYEKYGILLYAYSKWLENKFTKLNIKKVFFLSRDGYIMQKAFDICKSTPVQSKYLYVSRRSLNVPNLWKNPDFQHLDENISMSNYFNINTFISRLGLDARKYEEIYTKCKISKTDEFSRKNFKDDVRLRKLYEIIKNDVIENSKKEYDLVLKYLKQNEFEGKVAIVDIGWHGSMQKNIEKLCKSGNIETEIFGFYMGQEKIVNNGYGYLFNEFDNPKNKISIAGSFGFFESLFLANHGSIIKYKDDGDNIKPCAEKNEFDKEDTYIIRELQTGALDFVKDFDALKLDNIYFDNIAFNKIQRLLTNPNNNEINYFGNIKFNDTYISKIIETKNIFFYIFHLKDLKKDFIKCVWKMGFLKNVFKLNLPYFKLYYKLKIKNESKNNCKNYNKAKYTNRSLENEKR